MQSSSVFSASTTTIAHIPGLPAPSGLSERLAALALLVAAGPVIVGAAVMLGCTYRRWPFIAHRRMGRNASPFWMLKLRTMQPPGTSLNGGLFLVDRIIAAPEFHMKQKKDSRVTNRFAAFCRHHSIDELPQLLHVIRGQMALVGPRPLTAEELALHYGPSAVEILSVKPGLTGLWQVQGRSYLTMPERVSLDIELVRSTSRWTWLTIMIRTVRAVVSGEGAW